MNKLTPNYDPNPYIVKQRKGSMVTATRSYPSHTITRNISFFKKLKFLNVTNDLDSDPNSSINPLPPPPPRRISERIRREPVRYPELENRVSSIFLKGKVM